MDAELPEQARAELERRTAALARVPYRQRPGTETDMLMFHLGDERFALDAACVRQVAVLREFTPLPGAPSPLFGVTHWRGDVLTILDLRELLGVQVRGVSDLGRIIVIDGGERRFGVLADAVTDIAPIDIGRVHSLVDDGRDSLLSGATEDGLMIVNREALLQRFGTAGRAQTTRVRGG